MDIKKMIDNAEKIQNKGNQKRTQKHIRINRWEEELGMEDAIITIQKPTSAEMISIQEHKNEAYSLSIAIVNPNLNDAELQKAFGVNNAKALVNKMFTDEEKTEISTEIGKMLLIKNRTQVIDDIKN